MSLSLKILSAIFLITLLLFSVLAFFVVSNFKSYMEGSFIERARSTGLSLDAGIGDGKLLEDEQRMASFLNKHLLLDPTITGMSAIVVKDGTYVTFTPQGEKGSTTAPEEHIRVAYEDEEFGYTIIEDDVRTLRAAVPIHASGRVVGAFEIDLSLEELDEQIQSTLTEMLLIYVVVMVFFMVLIFFILRSIVIKPVNTLKGAFGEITQGNVGYTVEVRSKDEMGDLMLAFNQMSEILSASQKAVGEFSKKLEEQKSKKK